MKQGGREGRKGKGEEEGKQKKREKEKRREGKKTGEERKTRGERKNGRGTKNRMPSNASQQLTGKSLFRLAARGVGGTTGSCLCSHSAIVSNVQHPPLHSPTDVGAPTWALGVLDCGSIQPNVRETRFPCCASHPAALPTSCQSFASSHLNTNNIHIRNLDHFRQPNQHWTVSGVFCSSHKDLRPVAPNPLMDSTATSTCFSCTRCSRCTACLTRLYLKSWLS